MATKIPENLRIGVLIPEEVQLLDLSSVDLFPMLSQDYLRRCQLPESLWSHGVPSVEIYYIAETPAGSLGDTTAGARIRITHSINDAEVQPGKLDLILIPGPFPPANTTDKVKAFAQAHLKHSESAEVTGAKKTTFLVVCTGSFVAGNCGLFDGKVATGPRFVLPELAKLYPKAKWDSSRRWVRDGKVWSCGTICNGIDLVAAYMRETYPHILADFILHMAQVAERPAEYEETVEEDAAHFQF